MLAWIAQNIATIIISAILVLICTAIVIKQIKDKKRKRSSCGCNCTSCPMSGRCHK